MVLGGLNEGVWPALPAPDPWLAPKIRANLGLARPRVPDRPCRRMISRARSARRKCLITRARRDEPLADGRLALLAAAGGDDRRAGARHAARAAGCARSTIPGPPQPVDRPRATSATRSSGPTNLGDRRRPAQGRSVRLLRAGDARPAQRSTRSMPTIARRGRAPRSTRCSKTGSRRTIAIPTSCVPRAEALLRGRDDPSDAARALGAAAAGSDRLDRRAGASRTATEGRHAARGGDQRRDARSPASSSTARPTGSIGLPTGGLAIVDYKTGKPPSAEGGRRRLRAPARPARPDRRAGGFRRRAR